MDFTREEKDLIVILCDQITFKATEESLKQGALIVSIRNKIKESMKIGDKAE